MKKIHDRSQTEQRQSDRIISDCFFNFILLIFYITLFCQKVDEDDVQVESAPHIESLKPEETFSTEQQMTETEQETSSPLLQDQEKVSDLIHFYCLY